MAIRRTVLVADDKKAVAVVRGHLQKDGYRVYAARSGLEALNLIRRRCPDVVVVDRGWLERASFDLGEALSGATPIITLTAEAVDEELDAPIDSAVMDYVVKPIDPCEVLSRVRAPLRRVGKIAPDAADELHARIS